MKEWTREIDSVRETGAECKHEIIPSKFIRPEKAFYTVDGMVYNVLNG